MTVEALQAKLKNISADMLPAIEKGMNKATANVKAQAKDNINPATTIYYRPAYITGNLSRSIADKVEVKGNTVIGTIGAGGRSEGGKDVTYAKKIHEGTSKMPARPFLLDAIKEKENETVEFLSDAIEGALRKYTI
jgi:HK97 gp10 family phage protein